MTGLLLAQAAAVAPVSRVPLYIIVGYLAVLVGLGVVSSTLFRGTSSDYFVASRSIGPFLMLMSIFGTTMTAFALVGSTGEAFKNGAGVYGLLASSSGLVHSAIFFLVGIKLWAIGKRYGYMTQVEYFRARFESNGLGYVLFPLLIGLVVPYLLIGLLGANATVGAVTRGMYPETFGGNGAIPGWLTSLVISAVVLFYIFTGGLRSAAWANAFQTIVFMVMGVVVLWVIAQQLGGPVEATRKVLEVAPEKLSREGSIGKLQFISYMLVPLSVGMFPHLFQHWLTARNAKAFRLTVVAHPLFIMIVWAPCIMLGIWAVGAGINPPGGNVNAVLGVMVDRLVHSPALSGLMTAAVLAAIMSSLDSQFVSLGTMFTRDVVVHHLGQGRLSDRQVLLIGRGFIIAIVALTYGLAMISKNEIFDLAVWSFSGFSTLFPIVLAALYWPRATKAGVYASILAGMGVWLFHFDADVLRPAAGEGGGEYLVFGLMPVTFSVAASASALVIVSMFTRPPSAATVAKFFDLQRSTATP